jgi:hypothetical protein
MKTYTPPERFDDFFAPIVGDASHQRRARHLLAMCINVAPEADPYTRLREGYDLIVDKGMKEVTKANPVYSFGELLQMISIKANAAGGGRFVISALRAVGGIYANHGLDRPQIYGGVRTNTQRAVRYIHGIAFSGANVGDINLAACREGQNPRSCETWFPTAQKDDRTGKAFSPDMFTVRATDDGQLDIHPRYARLIETGDGRCPATYAKAEADGIQKPALLTLMQIVGDVAVEEIFARSFDISQMPPLA